GRRPYHRPGTRPGNPGAAGSCFSPGDLRCVAQPGAGAYAAVIDQVAAQLRICLGAEPLSPPAAQAAAGSPACTPLPRSDGAAADAGQTGSGGPYPQYSGQPAGYRE